MSDAWLLLPGMSEGKALLCQPMENGKDTLMDTALSSLKAAVPSDKKKRNMSTFPLHGLSEVSRHCFNWQPHQPLLFLFQQPQILGRAKAQNSHHLCAQIQT